MDYLYAPPPALLLPTVLPAFAQVLRASPRARRPGPLVMGVPPLPPPPAYYMPALVLPIPPYWGQRAGAVRGLYRVFNAAGYRFYRSNVAPPAAGDIPFATSTALPYTPAAAFADGTWYVSVSYFNGVFDSGFLPVGPHGETYLTLVIAAGTAAATRPSRPQGALLVDGGAGVVTVRAFYPPGPDAPNPGTQWAITYTTDGSSPPVPPAVAPTLTRAMGTGPLQVLNINLPALPQGTIVKVLLQVRRSDGGGGWIYSDAVPVMTATANAAGPSAPLALQSWPGPLPGGT